MRSFKVSVIVIVLAALASGLVSSDALARGGYRHHHSHSGLSLGFVFGGPLWYPAPAYSYPYPNAYPYSYPPAVVVNPAPRVYVEREDQIARESSPGYWYYCRESNVYYPYVRECAGPWERVPAQPQQ
jgi:hypothetical protein